MIATTPKSVRLWGRGQLTIPKEVRQALKLEDENQMSIFLVGRCLVLTPKKLFRSSLARDVQRSMKAEKIGLGNLLETLKKQRQRYNKENYAA